MAERSNQEWLADLRSAGPVQEAALADLRTMIQMSLPRALSVHLSPGDPQFGPLIEEATQETLVRVLNRLDEFQGRSRFTTWVLAIAVNIALSELRRRRWRDVSLEELLSRQEEQGGTEPDWMAENGPNVERLIERDHFSAVLERIIRKELTEKQRTALLAVAVRGMPMEEVARRMGMQRNALYKLLHDARIKLKRRLEEEGIRVDDVLTAFEG